MMKPVITIFFLFSFGELILAQGLGELERSSRTEGISCHFGRYPGNKFQGKPQGSSKIATVDACAELCWLANKRNVPCKSANFYPDRQVCEMLQDDAWNPSQGSKMVDDSSVTYVGMIDCEETLAPVPVPQPQPGQEPKNTLPKGSCGQTAIPIKAMRINNRIVGGNEAIKHSIPWIVSLRAPNGHYCGGTLIRVRPDKEETDIVVTAAHCMDALPRPFDVVAGAHHRWEVQPGEKRIQVAKNIDHPQYKKPFGHANDITILKLSQPIKFNDNIQPACLPEKNETPADGTMGIVAGWGYTASDSNGEWPDKLMNVGVPVMGTQECQKYYGLDPPSMLCAGFVQGGKDSCQGDSGGPYTTKGRKGYTLHGVVSFGNGCALANAPGVYARVTNYIDWIQEQVVKYSDVYRS